MKIKNEPFFLSEIIIISSAHILFCIRFGQLQASKSGSEAQEHQHVGGDELYPCRCTLLVSPTGDDKEEFINYLFFFFL